MRRILWEWGHSLDRIARLEDELRCFSVWAEDASDTLRAQRLTGTPGGGRAGDSVGEAVEELERRRALYMKSAQLASSEISAILRRKVLIDEMVSALPQVQKRVVDLRYIDGHRWTYIALKLHYDESSVRRLETAAVSALAERFRFDAEEDKTK
jgi:DNA-directed RNA polymerase specialized sigma24 family protein